jgi:hypothetical protein
VIPVNPQDVHTPWWTLTAMGLVFAAAGAGILGMSVGQHRAERRARDAAWQHPGQPALGDYPWDPRGFAAPRWSRAVKGLAGAAGMSLFFSIFNWWAFATDSPWMVKAITTVFDLLLILIWFDALRRVGVAVKFGGSRVEYTRFPYEVGGAVERFDPPPDAAPTRLHAPQPVFWEFHVTLDLPGLDFEEIYLVPVYGR